MIHLVVKPYDHALDYAAYCQRLFGDERCLVMLEKKGGDHLHIQGECDLTEKEITVIQKEMIAEHYSRRHEPTARPVKKRAKPADETGFQYMCKEFESSVVIYKQGFTERSSQRKRGSC